MIAVAEYRLGPEAESADRFPLAAAGEERGGIAADRFLTRVAGASVWVYLPDPARPRSRALALLCPGGGYRGLRVDHEGHDAARFFALRGLASLTLSYRLPRRRPFSPSLPRRDLDLAFELVREKAAEWGVDARAAGVVGFSAGGHLALDGALVPASGGADPAGNRGAGPAFAAAVYPVVTMEGPLAHAGSRLELLGDAPGPGELRAASMETRVSSSSPPLFLVHARDDPSVPFAHAELLAEAYRAAGVPCRFVSHPTGGHGFGLGPPQGFASAPDWAPEFLAWLAGLGFGPGG